MPETKKKKNPQTWLTITSLTYYGALWRKATKIQQRINVNVFIFQVTFCEVTLSAASLTLISPIKYSELKTTTLGSILCFYRERGNKWWKMWRIKTQITCKIATDTNRKTICSVLFNSVLEAKPTQMRKSSVL